MKIEDWAARWKEGRIGFHEGKANAFLAKYAAELDGRKRVLVPLCGKAEDLAFLAGRGQDVVGIEAVEDAVRAFFSEHDLEPIVDRSPSGLARYRAPGITLLAGDIFATTTEDVGDVDALYDRAALVALPPDVRPRYVAHLRSLLAKGARGVVVTFDYDQSRIAGPPFSVGEAEVRSLYDGASVTARDAAPGEGARFKELAIPVTERCFVVQL